MDSYNYNYYVTIFNPNTNKFCNYDVIPYLTDSYIKKYIKKRKRPEDAEEFIKFVDDTAKYQWWSRCEYEIILSNWPTGDIQMKTDVYAQVRMNLEAVCGTLLNELRRRRFKIDFV